jgi:hypothetical protein
MRYSNYDPFITWTCQEEIKICEQCPYKEPICGDKGCEHFKKQKRIIEQNRKEIKK